MRYDRCRLAQALSLLSLLGCLALATPSHAGEKIRIGGTGAALGAMRVLGAEIQKGSPGVRVEVLASLGSTGGIEALAEGVIDVALAARELKPEEKAKGVREAACVITALVFAANHQAHGYGIRRDELPALFRDPHPVWPDGTPLKIILRARSGSEYPYLIKSVPGMAEALDEAHRRRGVPVGATDQENADLAQRTAGSLAMTSLMQIRAERLKLHPVLLDGVEASPGTVADGSYPFPFRICLLLSAQPSAAAKRFVSFVQSPDGRDVLLSLGAVEEAKAVH
jgi:phosphate transport system substrate-binding protein